MKANRSDFIAELTQGIAREATAKDGGSANRQVIKADLNALAEQLVVAMVDRDEATVAKAYEAVERSYSEIVAKHGLGEQALDALTTAAELRGLTRFLGAAVQYRAAPQASDVIQQAAYRPLLDRLYVAPSGLESGKLAQVAGFAAATVARRLPYLRSVGLVRSQQVGKTMVNRLTDDARKRMTELYAEEKKAAGGDHPAIEWTSPAPVAILNDMGLIATAKVSGEKVKIDKLPAGWGALRRARQRHEVIIKTGKVPPPADTMVEIRAKDDTVANVILEKEVLVGLCKINDQVADNVDIYLRRGKIFANIGVRSEDDEKKFLTHGS